MIKKAWSWATATSTRELITLLIMVIIIRTFGFGLYEVPTGSMETTMLSGERFFADKFTPLFMRFNYGDIISFNDPYYKYSSNPLLKIFQSYFWGPDNWTKRIIGVPGDIVRGVIEDGKPVVYVNNKKLDEPYINKYPLVHMLVGDPAMLMEQAYSETLAYIKNNSLDGQYFSLVLSNILQSSKYSRPLSYDQAVSYADQPFYRMSDAQLLKGGDGKLLMTLAGSPLPKSGMKRSSVGNSFWDGTDEFYIELNDHQYWAMGDNRHGSLDCRFWGPLDEGKIRGRILFRIISRDGWDWLPLDLLKHPIDFWSRLRWSRFFQVVR